MILTLPKSSIQFVNELHVSSSLTVGSTKGATTCCRYTEGGVGVGSTTQAHVSWLRGRSKEKLCIHKPCSTGHQTGFIVRINCVAPRQEISKHISIEYYMLY